MEFFPLHLTLMDKFQHIRRSELLFLPFSCKIFVLFARPYLISSFRKMTFSFICGQAGQRLALEGSWHRDTGRISRQVESLLAQPEVLWGRAYYHSTYIGNSYFLASESGDPLCIPDLTQLPQEQL